MTECNACGSCHRITGVAEFGPPPGQDSVSDLSPMRLFHTALVPCPRNGEPTEARLGIPAFLGESVDRVFVEWVETVSGDVQ